MQSQSQKGYLFLLLVIVLAGLSGWLFQREKFLYGLDVQGGIRLSYGIQFDSDPKKAQEQRDKLPMIRRNLVRILQNRSSGALGVAEPSVQAKGETEFIVEIPGFKNLEEARQVLGSTAKLEAYHATTVVSSSASYRTYTAGGIKKGEDGNYYEVFIDKNNPSKEVVPSDPAYRQMIAGWTKILDGDELAQASIQNLNSGQAIPTFRFSESGARKMAAWSRSVMNRGESLAFVLDGRVISIAPVKDGAVLEDEAVIEGQFEPAYVRNLVELLNAGALPVQLVETSSMTVDPTIGSKALTQMVTAGAVSFAVIGLFLLVYYIFPGFVALVALLLYMLFTLTVLKLTNATFSLAAIAGFILSVGMAVDANILVFERVKEEMRDGRSLMTAVELGFKRAFPAILDSNACTILTSITLSIFGTGPVKGFASTLIIGVAISMFTAVVITRSLLVFLVGSGIGNNPKLFGLERSWFGEKYELTADENPWPIMKGTKKWFLISLVTIIPGLICVGMGGIKPNVEFSGGAEAVFILPANSTATSASITKSFETNGFPGSVVKIASDGTNKLAYATIPPHKGVDLNSEGIREEVGKASGLNAVPSNFSTVGPTVAQETIDNAVKGVVISSLLIVFYLAARFGVALGGLKNGLKFGLSAIGALVHDVLFVVGVAGAVGLIWGWEVSALFITAMLTVIGFSVHDTIVIFDRIRENLHRPQPGETFEHLCDRSVTRSFARSLNTSMTVIATLAILVAFGTATPDLKFFCVTMLAGILSGTYSSIFNATPILWLWDKSTVRRKGETAGFIGAAVQDQARIRAIQNAAVAETAAGNYGTVKRRDRVRDRARKDID